MSRVVLFFALLALLFVLSSPAWAQATGSIGASFTATNQPNSDQVGVNFGLKYWVSGGPLTGNLFAEGFARDGFGTRSRFGAVAGVKLGEFGVSGGAGYFCNTNCRDLNDGYFGQLGVDYYRFHGFGRYGQQQFLEAELAIDVANLGEHVGVQIFGRGTRLQTWCNQTQTIYPVGLRLTFK